jgi:2-polyprenyl-3-methyl-5-hydroxy-6-metoxy-1,4-benzoquinol methylase
MSHIGIQENGESPYHTKTMALAILNSTYKSRRLRCAADIGGGRGDFAQQLANKADQVCLVDHSPPVAGALPSNVKTIRANLNEHWPIENQMFEFVFSLECIEHVENPRHFMRELRRITRKYGYVFLTTPNQHSLASKLTFFVRGQHRFFQEFSYPAHITAILKCDFERMAIECGLKIVAWSYSNTDTIPLLHWRFRLPGSLLSETVGVLFQRLD